MVDIKLLKNYYTHSKSCLHQVLYGCFEVYREGGHTATTFRVSVAFPIKEKWSGKMLNRKKSMEVPKTGGARNSEGKVLVTK